MANHIDQAKGPSIDTPIKVSQLFIIIIT